MLPWQHLRTLSQISFFLQLSEAADGGEKERGKGEEKSEYWKERDDENEAEGIKKRKQRFGWKERYRDRKKVCVCVCVCMCVQSKLAISTHLSDR